MIRSFQKKTKTSGCITSRHDSSYVSFDSDVLRTSLAQSTGTKTHHLMAVRWRPTPWSSPSPPTAAHCDRQGAVVLRPGKRSDNSDLWTALTLHHDPSLPSAERMQCNIYLTPTLYLDPKSALRCVWFVSSGTAPSKTRKRWVCLRGTGEGRAQSSSAPLRDKKPDHESHIGPSEHNLNQCIHHVPVMYT